MHDSGFQANQAPFKPRRPGKPGKMGKRLAIGAVVVLLVVMLGANAFEVVPVGATGIMLTFGKVQDTALSEGVHMKIPFVQRIVSLDNRVKKLELNTEAFSKDIQTVSATLAVNYRLQNEKTFSIYKTAGLSYEENIIVPATHEVLKSVCAQYTAEELITKRAESSDKMREELDNKLSEIGISITDFNIIEFDFSEEYISAVEAKQVAEQVKKKAATENETALAQAEREKQVAIKEAEAEAEKLRIEAQGKAESTLIEAEAQADAVKLAADAEAYKLEQIAGKVSSEIIQKILAEQWDGELPQVAGGALAGIMDIGQLLSGGEVDTAQDDGGAQSVQPTQQP